MLNVYTLYFTWRMSSAIIKITFVVAVNKYQKRSNLREEGFNWNYIFKRNDPHTEGGVVIGRSVSS